MSPQPKLPPGFTLDAPAQSAQQAQTPAVRPPVGFTLDQSSQQGGGWLDSVANYAKGLWSKVNPVTVVEGLAQATSHPLDTAKAMLSAQGDLKVKADEAFKRGDYATGVRHAIEYLIPVLGPEMSAAGDKAASGKVAEAMGEATGIGLMNAVAPEQAAALAKRTYTAIPKFLNRNPAEAAAVAFGQERGIPVSAGVATGNQFVKGLQKVADTTPLGSIVADKAQAATATALRDTAGELGRAVYPDPITPEQAGSSARGAVQERVKDLHQQADVAYGGIRELEQDPANVYTVWVGDNPQTGKPIYTDMALPVDMRPVKAALAPIYRDLMRAMPVAQQRASPGLVAIHNIISEADFKPASLAETDLGAIKALARGADMPELRNVSQGLAAKAVTELDRAVRQAVSGAKRSGPAATRVVEQLPAGPQAQLLPGGENAGPRRATITTAGAQTKVKVPGETTTYPARYEVRELSDVQPSHDPRTFQRNPNYELTNDRDYTRAENQSKVVSWSSPTEFDPSFHITDNPDATNGPIIVDPRGNALGGNGRAMILGRVYESNPKGAAAYRQLLQERAAQYGVDPAQVAGMKQPVLVRVVDGPQVADKAGAQRAITDFNKKGTAELRPSERAIADSRRVSVGTLDDIAGRLERSGSDASLADVLDGKSGSEVLQRLIDDGVISPQERPAYADGNILTKEGRARISQLMLGRFFESPRQLDSLPDLARRKLERIAAPLARLEGTAFELSDTVRGAINLMEQARTAGAKGLDDYVRQAGLFGDQTYTPSQIQLAKRIENTPTQQLVDATRAYASDAEYASGSAGLFGDTPTPSDSFERAFGGTVEAAAPAAAPEASAAASTAVVPAAKRELITAPRVEGTPAGNEATQALQWGRKATAEKWQTGEVLKAMREEPVQAFGQTVYAKDAGIDHLRRLAREAPGEMPKIGRAYLEKLFDVSTAQGGFDSGARVWQEWQNLGPETKRLLYGSPRMVQDLDNFFLLVKKINENPNPSGSAVVAWIGAQGAVAVTSPLTGAAWTLGGRQMSKLLHSPKGVALLTQGLKIPVNRATEARASVLASQLLRIAGEDVERDSKAQPLANNPRTRRNQQ